MPKMKTNRAAAKRFKITGTGKISRGHNFARHKLTKKSTKRKRTMRASGLVSASDMRRVGRQLGIA